MQAGSTEETGGLAAVAAQQSEKALPTKHHGHPLLHHLLAARRQGARRQDAGREGKGRQAALVARLCILLLPLPVLLLLLLTVISLRRLTEGIHQQAHGQRRRQLHAGRLQHAHSERELRGPAVSSRSHQVRHFRHCGYSGQEICSMHCPRARHAALPG